MNRILVISGGALGLALALMVGAGVAVASPERTKYETAQMVALDCVTMAADVEALAAVKLEPAVTQGHDFAVAANFRKESAGMVLSTVELRGPGDGDTGPYS
jgi:hypothetical protein